MLILVRTNNLKSKIFFFPLYFQWLSKFNHLIHKKINVKHMVLERGLNLHIKVEGLSSRHYNTRVNPKFVMVWSSQNWHLFYGQHVLLTMAITNNSWGFNPNMQYPHMKTIPFVTKMRGFFSFFKKNYLKNFLCFYFSF